MGFWRSDHPGASSLRGTLYLLALGAVLALLYAAFGGVWWFIFAVLSVFSAVVWFLMSREDIVTYARSGPVLRYVLGLIFLAIGLGFLAMIPVMWESVKDPSNLSPRARANPYLPIGVAVLVGLGCLGSAFVLLFGSRSQSGR